MTTNGVIAVMLHILRRIR